MTGPRDEMSAAHERDMRTSALALTAIAALEDYRDSLRAASLGDRVWATNSMIDDLRMIRAQISARWD